MIAAVPVKTAQLLSATLSPQDEFQPSALCGALLRD